MKMNTGGSAEISRDYTAPIVGVLAVAVLPLWLRLPFWVALWCLMLWGYALAAAKKEWPLPGRAVRTALVALGLMLVLTLMGGFVIGGTSFVAILVMMAGIKPLEIKDHRDRMAALFLVYFVIITGLFTFENLAMTAYMIPTVLAATACLLLFNDPAARLSGALKRAGILMVQALPLVVVLFLLFPRFGGGVFMLAKSGAGRTGFTDHIQPGTVSRLARSDRTAFRVEFENRLPPAVDLYWRGLVLWEFDGVGWQRGVGGTVRTALRRVAADYRYTITLEPHRMPYLFALDVPLSTPFMARMTEDYTLVARWPVRRTLRYQVQSQTRLRPADSGKRLATALALPPDGNFRSRQMAQRWKAAAENAADVVQSALEFFSQNDFGYTLDPPLLGANPIDDFVFNTRRGFCEHYASAFAYLMRAAGVPARVVVGYLGGDLNPYGNYLIVRQANAHAWVEVFMPAQGWVRVDPTLVVAPERASLGPAAGLNPAELPPFLSPAAEGSIRRFYEKIRLIYDIVNLRWNSWFMDFSVYDQISLWRRLQQTLRIHARWYLFTGLLCLAAGVVFFMLFRKRGTGKQSSGDPAKAVYHRFCRKMARAGITRKPAQGPLDYRDQIVLLRPELKPAVDAIIDTYISLRYRPGGDDRETKRFLRLVRRLRTRIKR